MASVRLSDLADSEFADRSHDVRDWTLLDRYGNALGKVEEVFVDSETRRLDHIVIDGGLEYSASEIEIRDGGVYLRNSLHKAEGSSKAPRMRCTQKRPRED